jgi:hypothetical protein
MLLTEWRVVTNRLSLLRVDRNSREALPVPKLGHSPIGLKCALNESNQVFAVAYLHLLEEAADGVLLEVL